MDFVDPLDKLPELLKIRAKPSRDAKQASIHIRI